MESRPPPGLHERRRNAVAAVRRPRLHSGWAALVFADLNMAGCGSSIRLTDQARRFRADILSNYEFKDFVCFKRLCRVAGWLRFQRREESAWHECDADARG